MDPSRYRRAKEIFAEALTRSVAERAAWLGDACAGDATLRAEVDALLASDRKAAEGPLAHALSEDGSKTVSTSPGDMIAGRYRIVAPLGRGGMGEVYLAEDLTLGQQVAIKFLSGHIAARQGGMERFLNEVRVARRVGHPNVARVHDVGEADGRHFLSMEYVSGEDLSHLLKRIGRLPREKAQEIARQLCAGLDAIHSAGILHRDLKPANVMLDGEGNVRITDFGLAESAQDSEASDEVAGTPAYMAPEQLEGHPASERSEVFSLGLLLYELFTGKRAFKGRTFLELKADYAEQTPSSPSSVITDFDPQAEEAILACLQKNPQDRPPSVGAVALSLPGGDPLAAAVAAGKTPAPQAVADAPDTSGMRPWVALACLCGFLLLVALGVHLKDRVHQSMPPHPPEVLIKAARDFLAEIGHDVPRHDSIHSFAFRDARHRDAFEVGETGARNPLFWYRESPVDLFRWNQFRVGASWHDPPHEVPGMVRIRMATRGELRSFSRVPPAYLGGDSGQASDWTPFFEAAGLADLPREPVEARWSHDVHADAAYAWELAADEGQAALRVEAASAGGEPCSFQVMRKDREAAGATRPPGATSAFASIMLLVLIVAGAILAKRNLALGRGDRRGATRLALFIFFIRLVSWVAAFNHSSSVALEARAVVLRLSSATYDAVLVAVLYLAIEPYFRRLWPRLLVSWVRMLDGRWRDPLVARDVLLGALLGSAVPALVAAYHLTLARLGHGTESMIPVLANGLYRLAEPGYVVSFVTFDLFSAIAATFFVVACLVVLRVVLRKRVAAVSVLVTLGLAVHTPAIGPVWLRLGVGVLLVAVGTTCLLRVGILGVVVFHLVVIALDNNIITFDLNAWYLGRSSVVLLVIVLLGVWGFRVTTAGRPMFRDALSER